MRRRSSRSARPSRAVTRFLLFVNLAVACVGGGWYLLQPATRQAEVKRLVSATFARDKHVSPLDVAWDLWQLYYADSATGRLAPGDRTIVYGGAPASVAPSPASPPAPLRLLTHRGFVVGYDDTRGNPAWAAYRVRDLPTIPTPPPRPDKFETDRRTVARVAPDDYTGSGYDRGHLAPNFAIATRYGAAAQRETFLMSNITPQLPALNSGLWRELEQKIATAYPARFGEVWVLTGPVYGTSPRQLHGRIDIPEGFFLIVIDEHEGRLRTLALIVPQDAPANADPARYLTTIADIQRRTHLDFLRDLDDAPEALVEAHRANRLW